MADVTELTEQRQTAANYVLQFFNETTLITHHYAVYLNLLVELEAKHGNISQADSLSDDERAAIIQQLQNLRYHSHIAYIQVKTILKSSGKEFDKTKIEDSYKNVRDTFIITREQANEFLESLTEFLASAIMKELLKTSQDVVNSVYKD